MCCYLVIACVSSLNCVLSRILNLLVAIPYWLFHFLLLLAYVILDLQLQCLEASGPLIKDFIDHNGMTKGLSAI